MIKGLRSNLKTYWYSYIWLIFLIEDISDEVKRVEIGRIHLIYLVSCQNPATKRAIYS